MKKELIAKPDTLKSRYKGLKNSKDVAKILEVPEYVLEYYIDPQQDHYTKFLIPKKSGGERKISAPHTPIKLLQRKFKSILETVYSPHVCATGYWEGSGVVNNASRHIQSKFVINIDLEDFFPSITFRRVVGLFMGKPYYLPQEVATIFAKLTCFENSLPQGAPTSPIISNILCYKMDGQLRGLCKSSGCTYSRYADDITISTMRSQLPESIARKTIVIDRGVNYHLGFGVEEVIKSNDFKVNYEKFRVMTKSSHQGVTGITVNQKLNVSRKYIRQVRAMMHAVERFGLKGASNHHEGSRNKPSDKKEEHFKKILRGKIDYVGLIKGRDNKTYRKYFNKYCEKLGDRKKILPMNLAEELLPKIWVVAGVGSGFLLKNNILVTCFHNVKDLSNYSEISVHRYNEFANPFTAKLMTFSEAHDIALYYLESTEELPFYSMGDEVESHEKVLAAGFGDYHQGERPRWFSNMEVTTTIKNKHGSRVRLINGTMIGGVSGGPVLNKQGKVVGVAKWGSPDQKSINEGFNHGFVPIVYVSSLLDSVS